MLVRAISLLGKNRSSVIHLGMEYEPCTFSECQNVQWSAQLCRAHYQQNYLGKTPGPVQQVPVVPCVTCHTKPGITKGECKTCEGVTRRQNKNKSCTAEGCDRRHHGKGYCRTHLKQLNSDGVVEPLRDYVIRGRNGVFDGKGFFVGMGSTVCGVADCGKPGYSSGLCSPHAQRAVKFGMSAETAIEWFSVTECEVCGGPAGVIDHDHSCCNSNRSSCGNCNRGVLCNGCNSALGFTQDDPARLMKLAEYLMSKS